MNAVIQPQVTAAQQARDAALAQAQQRAGFITSLYAALGKAQQPQADQAATDWAAAGDRQATYAKGFSVGQQMAVSQATGQANTELQKQGLTPSVQDTGQAGADVLYGLGGYNPASVFNTGGAAFKTLADRQAADVGSAGGLLSAAALLEGGQNAASGYNQELARIEAQRAQLTPQIASDLRTADFQKAQFAADQAQRKLDNAYRAAGLKLDRRKANQPDFFGSPTGGYYAYDPVSKTIQQVIAGTGPAPAKPQVIGGDATGRWAWDPNTNQLTPLVPPVKGAGKQKFTAKQIADFKSTAADSAKDAWTGVPEVDKNGKPTGKWTVEPMHYQQAMMYLLDHGIPLGIAQNALNRYWTRPGYEADVPARQKATLAGQTIAPMWSRSGAGRPTTPFQQRQGKGDAAAETAASPKAQAVVSLAKEALGTPYVWGGESKSGFDCSGLLQYVWGKMGVAIPRTTYDQWTTGASVPRNQLQPGDAVFFKGSDPKFGKPGHVGMYIGGGQFIEAPRTGLSVRVSKLVGRSDFVGARRYA